MNSKKTDAEIIKEVEAELKQLDNDTSKKRKPFTATLSVDGLHDSKQLDVDDLRSRISAAAKVKKLKNVKAVTSKKIKRATKTKNKQLRSIWKQKLKDDLAQKKETIDYNELSNIPQTPQQLKDRSKEYKQNLIDIQNEFANRRTKSIPKRVRNDRTVKITCDHLYSFYSISNNSILGKCIKCSCIKQYNVKQWDKYMKKIKLKI